MVCLLRSFGLLTSAGGVSLLLNYGLYRCAQYVPACCCTTELRAHVLATSTCPVCPCRSNGPNMDSLAHVALQDIEVADCTHVRRSDQLVVTAWQMLCVCF